MLGDLDERLRETMGRAFNTNPDEFPETARILEFPGWDSMGHAVLMLSIESTFGICIPVGVAVTLGSFHEIRTYLETTAKAEALQPTAGLTRPAPPAEASVAPRTHELTSLLRSALDRAEIESGDRVLLHSFMIPPLVHEGALNEVVHMFDDVLGPKGTLVVPTFTDSFTERGCIDRHNTPSATGILTEHIRCMPDVKISPHAYHRFAARGADASAITAPHGDSSFGPDSPLQRMHESGAKLLFLCVDMIPLFDFTWAAMEADPFCLVVR